MRAKVVRSCLVVVQPGFPNGELPEGSFCVFSLSTSLAFTTIVGTEKGPAGLKVEPYAYLDDDKTHRVLLWLRYEGVSHKRL